MATGGIRFQFTPLGDKQIDRQFLRFGTHARDMRPAFNEIADQIMAIETWMFDSSGAIGRSGAWAPLRLATIAKKQRTSSTPTKVLVNRDELRPSVTQRGAKYQILEIGSNYMRFGTDHPGGIFHQGGTRYMRRRKIFDFRREHKLTMMRPIHRRLFDTR